MRGLWTWTPWARRRAREAARAAILEAAAAHQRAEYQAACERLQSATAWALRGPTQILERPLTLGQATQYGRRRR